MIVVPLVFFSIADGVTGFSDMKIFGRIGVKVLISYTLTTIFAMVISYTIFLLILPGDASMMPSVMKIFDASYEVSTVEISLKNTLIGIIPTSFLGAFVNGDMLQVIFLAVLIGFASGLVRDHSVGIQTFIRAGNELFSKITEFIIKLLPIAIFSMSFSLLYYLDFAVLLQIAKLFVVLLFSAVAMYTMYTLIILIGGKYNSLKFFKAFKKGIVTAFSTCSSGATMPFIMEALRVSGVSPKVYSFSVPLGATINMDGASINFTLCILFACRIFGHDISLASVLPLMLSVILISFGCPCAPGSGFAFMALLLMQANLPIGLVAFLAPITSIFEFIETVLNVTGDAAVTLAVARSENLMSDTAE